MSPTIIDGSWLFVRTGPWLKYEPGDVILAHSARRQNDLVIKRILYFPDEIIIDKETNYCRYSGNKVMEHLRI